MRKAPAREQPAQEQAPGRLAHRGAYCRHVAGGGIQIGELLIQSLNFAAEISSAESSADTGVVVSDTAVVEAIVVVFNTAAETAVVDKAVYLCDIVVGNTAEIPTERVGVH